MSRQYRGDLAKPIKLAPLPLLYTSEQREAWSKAHIAELERRMDLLMDEHGVKSHDICPLARSLALDLPGFQLAGPTRRGRNKHWDQHTRTLLVLSIEELQAQEFSITGACERLAAMEPWKSKVTHSNGARRLRDEFTRLDELERSLLPIFRDQRNLMIASGEITDEPGAFARKYLTVNYTQDEPQSEQ
ncbi:hypothetical protein [Pseudomonas izuensis]|uniref:hypothetical protein n=1 Tax=Pseudomonas izuensis TaxID=2684212 RepID=UPI001358C893|nr:hypothetical protein [Pseudomonas izuensis]